MAKILREELTNFGAWQIEKYGDLAPDVETTPEGELVNSGIEAVSRLAEWIFHQHENKIQEYITLVL